MGKHYCDYCDVFLTHDSVSVRKAHNSGRNHLQNVRDYYQTLEPAQIQQVIDTLANEYTTRRAEMPRDLLQPAGSSFMTFGAGPLSGTSDRAFSSRSGPPPMQSVPGMPGAGSPGTYPRYGPPRVDSGGPPNFSRSSSGPYSRPPPPVSASAGGAYPNRAPPPNYGAGPPAPYGTSMPSGPPPGMKGQNAPSYSPSRSTYGPH